MIIICKSLYIYIIYTRVCGKGHLPWELLSDLAISRLKKVAGSCSRQSPADSAGLRIPVLPPISFVHMTRTRASICSKISGGFIFSAHLKNFENYYNVYCCNYTGMVKIKYTCD